MNTPIWNNTKNQKPRLYARANNGSDASGSERVQPILSLELRVKS